MLGLALRRTEAGEIVLAQQGAGRRAHGGHVQRLEAPAGAPGPQRGTHAAAPQQIDVGARTGRETGVEIVRNLPGPLHGDRRRQEGVHAAHPGLHAPVQRRVQVHDLHGAVHAGVGATRADGGHRARHAAEAGQRGLQRVLHGLAVRLRLPTLPGRAVVGQPQCDSGHRSGLGSARAARFIRRRLVQVEADGLELAVQRGRVQRRLGVSVGFLVVIATARAARRSAQAMMKTSSASTAVTITSRLSVSQDGAPASRSDGFWSAALLPSGAEAPEAAAWAAPEAAPTEAAAPATPAAPAAELEPAAPAAPVVPADPAAPVAAVDPAAPAAPVAPVDPAAPAPPAAAADPAVPAAPAAPPDPAAPAAPSSPQHPQSQRRRRARSAGNTRRSRSTASARRTGLSCRALLSHRLVQRVHVALQRSHPRLRIGHRVSGGRLGIALGVGLRLAAVLSVGQAQAVLGGRGGSGARIAGTTDSAGRGALPLTTVGFAPAAAPRRERYLAKASACSLKIRRASAGSIARTASASGMESFCPALSRFMLLCMKA